MTKRGSDNPFVPAKLDFSKAADEDKFYIYCIQNTDINRYYIGISRHPARRVNEQLKSKRELCDDWARVAPYEAGKQNAERSFKFNLLNEHGYPNAFIGCIAETLYMFDITEQGGQIYNQNFFGAHPSIGDKRKAFEAIVKIVNPAHESLPSSDEMQALNDTIHEIDDYISQTNNQDIINTEFKEKLETAWDAHLERLKKNGFGRKKDNDFIPVVLKNSVPVLYANDNLENGLSPQISDDADIPECTIP
ncbi:MAG: GIY-YIG nuclease family protein [Alphaproteobacteria bacterium]